MKDLREMEKLDFSIFDIYSSLNEKGIIKVIKEINDFLATITGIGILVNRLFEINIQVCVQNKDREEVLKKVLERLDSTVVNIF